MCRVLFIVPDKAGGGVSELPLSLASLLPANGFDVEACALQEEGLPGRHPSCHILSWARTLDMPAFRRLRAVVRTFSPDLVHAWTLPAARISLLAAGRRPVIASNCLEKNGRSSLGWLDRMILGRAAAITVAGPSEAAAGQEARLPVQKLAIVPPGVASDPEVVAPDRGLPERLRLPRPARLIACFLPPGELLGALDALWALDILRLLYDDLYLVFYGVDPEAAPPKELVRRFDLDDRVRFWDRQMPPRSLLSAAELLWVPRPAGGASYAALQALAAGRPVIAGPAAALAEIVRPGETGYILPPSEKAALARQTRLLLDDHKLRQRLGEGSRRRAEQFSAAAMLEKLGGLYERVRKRKG
jgi:glycosyltransferase involved in cell wall biosynthesis